MARQRMVKPDIFQHAELHRAEMVSALPLIRAYIGLWCQADRRGCFFWKPATLKLNILPFDDVDFEQVLSTLEAHGFIIRYVVEGRQYGWIPTFERHQHFHRDEKPNPLIPDPPKHDASTVPTPGQHHASTPASVAVSTPTPTSASAARATTAAGAALELTTAANKAVIAKFGEQTDPLLPSSGPASALASAVLDASIPLDFAKQSIVRQIESSASRPPRSMKYFLSGIREDWEKSQARHAAGAAPRVLPLNRRAEPQATMPPRGLSPPPKNPDVKCAACGATEVQEQHGRLAVKHRPKCPRAEAATPIAEILEEVVR